MKDNAILHSRNYIMIKTKRGLDVADTFGKEHKNVIKDNRELEAVDALDS